MPGNQQGIYNITTFFIGCCLATNKGLAPTDICCWQNRLLKGEYLLRAMNLIKIYTEFGLANKQLKKKKKLIVSMTDGVGDKDIVADRLRT